MIPRTYAWLGTIGQLPRVVDVSLRDYGLAERIGTANNPVILDWADEAGVRAIYTDDSTPWCGLAMAHWCIAADKRPIPDTPLWAKAWGKYGTASLSPVLGDVLVFNRPGGGGHVGVYIAEDAAAYHVLGGNTGDAVKIARIARSRLVASRRPPIRTQLPMSAKAYRVATGGALSSNEA